MLSIKNSHMQSSETNTLKYNHTIQIVLVIIAYSKNGNVIKIERNTHKEIHIHKHNHTAQNSISNKNIFWAK